MARVKLKVIGHFHEPRVAGVVSSLGPEVLGLFPGKQDREASRDDP